MELYYFRFPNGTTNFGDDLNPWLWEKLLPDVFDGDNKSIFVGIGTLLNKGLPKANKTAVFGSGVGYGGGGLPTIDESWKIYCVRGPLSAKKLGIAPELAVTDGAALIRRVYKPSTEKRTKFAYMPHIRLAIEGDTAWKDICEEAGISYIDPRWTTETVLSAICQTEVLLTEAMHGAIIADALRVPWVPVVTSTLILPFKWQDWCSTVGLEYEPKFLMPSNKLYPIASGIEPSLRFLKKYTLQAPGRLLKSLFQKESKKMATQLVDIAKTSQPNLSSDIRIEQLTVQLEERLQQFKKDLADGFFNTSN
ncbi:MAG: polysaccharide pyruvyl transferase family protein [Cyanobacteria bacterium P01_D01_bin.50]